MAHGFSLEFLAGLVRDELVNEFINRVRIGKREMDVVRLSITPQRPVGARCLTSVLSGSNSLTTRNNASRGLSRAPARVAVLVKKEETPHLTVLARTAQVVGTTDPDKVFRRAA
jgi:hypothetical protein